MTTALCLYGHFRCFDACWQGLNEYLIKPNNISHVFAMVWVDSMGYFQHPTVAVDALSHPGYDQNSNTVDGIWLQKTLEKLNPTRVHLDNYHLHDTRFADMIYHLKEFNHHSPNHRPKGTLGQVWGRCASLNLAAVYENTVGQVFDRIVCTRWDIGYQHPIDLNYLDRNVISMDGMYGPNVISDAWACGPSTAMKLWSRQFQDIPLLMNNRTMNLGPHEWLKAHFDHHNIPWSNCSDVGIYINR